jgi:hypothetical protein
MKKYKSLTIRIPNPCSQDWNTMSITNGGRYCDKCTQVVHDFSQMPDAELLQYFKNFPATTCGRFHERQLDRTLQSQQKRWSLPTYLKKTVAAVLAALSFRAATAQGIIKSKATIVTQPAATTGKDPIPENIIISGTVTKGNLEPVANAKVSIDSLITVYTDTAGKFSISLNSDMIASRNLYFSYEGLERTVRNFHPLMGSTNYDVRLSSAADYNLGYHFMGRPVFNNINFPSIRFFNRQRFLDKDAKAILNSISEKLKDNPSVLIQLIAYGNNINDIKNGKRKLKLIRSFLINDLNIDKDRVFEKIEPAGSNDTIDIFQYSEE